MRKANPDSMYNKATKSMWAEDYLLSHRGDSLRGVVIGLMSRFAPYEKALGADLCTWTDTDYIKRVLSDVLPPATMTRKSNIVILRNYVAWCVDHAVPGAVNVLNSICYNDDADLSAYKRLVSNPKHLAVYLDQVLGTELRINEDCVRRCFMWLAFIGIPTGEATLVSCKDINFDNMEIVYNQIPYRIYHESVKALRMIAESDTIERVRGQFVHIEQRSPGNMLLRGIGDAGKPDIRYDTLSRTLSKMENEAIRSGKTDRRLSYTDVYRSGVFYRMYNDEVNGFPVDFSVIPGIFGSKTEDKTTIQYIIRKYRQDYENWKRAYR